MEAWKLQTIINNFTQTCDEGGHDIIKYTKQLSRTYDRLSQPEQRKDVLEQVFPYLDDPRAHVRQCAACVVLAMPVEKFSAMPDNLHIQIPDEEGRTYYEREWTNTVPASVQQPAWMEFVAKHMIYLEDKKAGKFLG